jgi:hypothetical protein
MAHLLYFEDSRRRDELLDCICCTEDTQVMWHEALSCPVHGIT